MVYKIRNKGFNNTAAAISPRVHPAKKTKIHADLTRYITMQVHITRFTGLRILHNYRNISRASKQFLMGDKILEQLMVLTLKENYFRPMRYRAPIENNFYIVSVNMVACQQMLIMWEYREEPWLILLTDTTPCLQTTSIHCNCPHMKSTTSSSGQCTAKRPTDRARRWNKDSNRSSKRELKPSDTPRESHCPSKTELTFIFKLLLSREKETTSLLLPRRRQVKLMTILNSEDHSVLLNERHEEPQIALQVVALRADLREGNCTIFVTIWNKFRADLATYCNKQAYTPIA